MTGRTLLRWGLPLLLVAMSINGCAGGDADRVRGEALVGTRAALELAHQNPDMISSDGEAQGIWTETLLALEKANAALSDCEARRGDDCLAEGLSQLLDIDRQLLLLEQTNGVDREGVFDELQKHARQAAGLLYVHFYGDGAGEGEDWRGPPTPRPPGVCPG